MSLSWSNEETFKFIELYQSEPTIWDPKSACHKDKNKVNDAWNRIADSLEIPVSELKKKKETLMSAFRMHFKKKQASIRSSMGEEEIYKPIWVFYDVMEAFLKGKYECKSIISTEGQSNSIPLGEKAGIGEEKEEETETSNDDGSNIEKSDTNIKSPVQRRRAVKPSEVQRAEKEMTNAFNTLNQIMLNEGKKIEDDCELYGRLLATKLRKYSESERQEIMYEIDGLMLRRGHNCRPQCVSSPSQIIVNKRPSSATSYSSPSPSSPYVTNRLLSPTPPHNFQDQSQIPYSQTYLVTAPIQKPSHIPPSQIPASEQPSYTQEAAVYMSPQTPGPTIHIPCYGRYMFNRPLIKQEPKDRPPSPAVSTSSASSSVCDKPDRVHCFADVASVANKVTEYLPEDAFMDRNSRLSDNDNILSTTSKCKANSKAAKRKAVDVDTSQMLIETAKKLLKVVEDRKEENTSNRAFGEHLETRLNEMSEEEACRKRIEIARIFQMHRSHF